MKKCIFICVFNKDNYIRLLFLLLESIFIYGNCDNDTDILIYTSSHFRNIIQFSHLYNAKIKFEINDTYNNVDLACKSRLDLFKLSSSIDYDTFLYLDTDILIKNDINIIFNVAKDDVLYALEEGTIDHPYDYWGNTLFGDEVNTYSDKTAFSSGVLLFNNCEKIRDLFIRINEDIINRPKISFYDQPYIVYNAFKYNVYDNKKLNQFIVINEYNIHTDKVIYHFAGGPGDYGHKLVKMNKFLSDLKDYSIHHYINKAKEYINEFLLPIIQNSNELLEGNIFMVHNTTVYTNIFENKSKNISNLVLNTSVKNVMEIGFNAGFSTLLMLLSNPYIKITCFDLCEHKYTLPCYTKLKETFGDRIHLIGGDSTKTLPLINETYDLIHIDGGHSTEIAESDIINSFRLSKKGTILIMDDYDFDNLHTLWDKYIDLYKLQDLDISTYNSPHHDIKYICYK
jgi:predicted O-methyltransferase YrrM